MATHVSQLNPIETEQQAATFMEYIRKQLNIANRDKRVIFNMDQTPIHFSMTPNRTIEKVGARTVNVRSSTASTMRVTVAVTISADGDVLQPLIVYKGFRIVFHVCILI
jgi:hypothetical protein